MADMRLDSKNNQAKEVIVARSSKYATNASGKLFNLPVGGVVTKVTAVITKADTTADANNPSTLSIKVDGTEIASVETNATGIKQVDVTDLAAFAETGGVVTIIPGNAAGDGEMFVILDIVTNNTTGAYLG